VLEARKTLLNPIRLQRNFCHQSVTDYRLHPPSLLSAAAVDLGLGSDT